MNNPNIQVNVRGPIQASSTYKTIVLKGNQDFASQISGKTNHKFIIKYDFDLGEASVTIPANCVLEFEGGSLSNGTIVGSNTTIDAEATKIFDTDITLAGTWNVKEGYPQWFGIYPDDDSVDTTPAIKKMVAVSIPIFFCSGTWYLSECLLTGKKTVNIKGTSTHYKVGTVFKAFKTTGQRFILKLGGLADFGKPTDYYEVWCSNFILDGISFNTNDTTLVNANPSMGQNYAAVCFDWCVDGYVNIRHAGSCPAVFIANTWEVYFECISCYGSYTASTESAVYFGKAYVDVAASNISAVTINNLFGECIYGKFVDVYGDSIINGANVQDLIINNIEFEPSNALPSDKYSHKGSQAYDIINGNIRNMDIRYYLNLSGQAITINSIVYCLQSITFNNDTTAAGLLKTTTFGSRVSIGGVYLPYVDSITAIFGAENNSFVTVNKIICKPFTSRVSVYTDTDILTDFYRNIQKCTGIVEIKNSDLIVDKDLIKLYNSGLLFNADNFSEVSNIEGDNNHSVKVIGKIDDIDNTLLYFRDFTLGRKFRFNGQKLKFRYIASQGSNGSITINYYKNGNTSPIKTDIEIPKYFDNVLLSYEYKVCQNGYDYCTLSFNKIYIESVSIIAEEEKAVVYGSEISNDVVQIMSHYCRNDAYKMTALQYFFNKIGDIKDKLNHLILPIFADNINEAIYDVITGTPFYNVAGTNYLEFNKPTRRVHLTINEQEASTWMDIHYEMYSNDIDFEGALTVLSATDGLGSGITPYDVGYANINSANHWWLAPTTNDNKKIIGFGIVNYEGNKHYLRLADTELGDRLTTDNIPHWEKNAQVFGQKPVDKTRGVRILVSTDQLITADEAKILRDAVIELDDKFAALDAVNDNFTPAIEKLIIPDSGNWTSKPISSDYNIPRGFAYFCVDKQTEEGATDGIMIYYKGQDTTDPDNPVDIWVDALGRTVS